MLFQEWRLVSTIGEPITLTFETLDTEKDLGTDNCLLDWVEINDGVSTQRYCGRPWPLPGPFTSNTTITVKFSSDMGRTGTGFLAVVCCSVNVTSDVTLTTGQNLGRVISSFHNFKKIVLSIHSIMH